MLITPLLVSSISAKCQSWQFTSSHHLFLFPLLAYRYSWKTTYLDIKNLSHQISEKKRHAAIISLPFTLKLPSGENSGTDGFQNDSGCCNVSFLLFKLTRKSTQMLHFGSYPIMQGPNCARFKL